ncbi:histidinol dehydrogenase [Leptospira ellinghausenii]|uniref:Histidinol dehydrogenase n=1 Tax=Leptospira ellinghausenii TaxID=1917822 RepID=A0A2P2DIN7_9LEPT|nr:hypothetical protein [Leptospira ellinghausenii]GBF44464.1 histidinol dehydrogenase [Leptospira ellinghausenii]
MIKLKRQSDNDQFISTTDVELFYQNPELIPQCLHCKKIVAYYEKEGSWIEFACHGNILRFYIEESLVSRVEEL